MNLLIVNTHWNNRGDEAAFRAMIDTILEEHPDAKLWVLMNRIKQFPYHDHPKVAVIPKFFPTRKNLLEMPLILLSHGRLALFDNSRAFCGALRKADLVIHAPGGPSIGDIYAAEEWRYLTRLFLAIWCNKPIFFYAPSMGPFQNRVRNLMRRFILNKAACICVREGLSQRQLDSLNLKQEVHVTLDAAIQNTIDSQKELLKLKEYGALNDFLSSPQRIVGVTITNLQWNPRYQGNLALSENIRFVFTKFLEYLTNKGYKILFIPQLFGDQNDSDYMNSFINLNNNHDLFVLSDQYDVYFQQFIISKVYALIGMRYHSNIFAAKMSIPFISISYEQKMKGFMEKVKLSDYCLDINDLTAQNLSDLFEQMEREYDNYRNQLLMISSDIKRESSRTNEYLNGIIKKLAFERFGS
ncbi:MAG TPA: polysaccharide pyruvyl transferase family protein [Bacillota bacterium]|nr:polysaccharide pyruvyl transferase family protein [Bacillota bacterium]